MQTNALVKKQKKLEAEEDTAKRQIEAIKERLAKIDVLLRRGAGREYLQDRQARAA